MKTLLLAICLIGAFAATANAQCAGGLCGLAGARENAHERRHDRRDRRQDRTPVRAVIKWTFSR